MNLFVLSELHPSNTHVGWSVSYGIEETLSTICNAVSLYPMRNDNSTLLSQYKVADDRIDFLKRYRHRIFKSWYEVDALPQLGDGLNILLVVGIQPRFLLSMFALGSLLDQFDLRVGYLLDGFDPNRFNQPPLSKLDHLFVISAELAADMRVIHGIKASFLPLGIDTRSFGEYRTQRNIDVIGYGRTDPKVHRYLHCYYNHPSSIGAPSSPENRLYLHSTFAQPEVHSPKEHRVLLAKLLTRSKISLCFEASDVPRFQGRSPILYRWFEGWAAGCAIVGKRPFGQGVAPLMDWQDSTLDIPDDAQDWIPFFEELLDDSDRLLEISRRNYRECRLRHDWCHRLRDMFTMLNLPVPKPLTAAIAELAPALSKPQMQV